jgi:TonB family protein
LPFTLTLLIGAALGSAMSFFSPRAIREKKSVSVQRTYTAGCKFKQKSFNSSTSPIYTYEPNTRYTREAWRRGVTGVVRLRVNFGADGTIKSVVPTERLPYGLTKEAEKVAWQIRFIPATVNGEPVSVTKDVDYVFSLNDRMAAGL